MKPHLVFFLTLFTFQQALAQDTVTVSGTITNPKEHQVYVKYYKDYISYAEAIADSAQLDGNGKFTMTFAWDRPYPATFFHGDEITGMFLSPDDNLVLTLDTKAFDETVKYAGTGSIVNNYLAQKALLFPPVGGNTYKKPELEFIRTIDSLHLLELNYFREYFSWIQDPANTFAAFKSYEESNIKYNLAVQKMTYPSYNRYLNRPAPPQILSSAYYDFLNEIQPFDPEAMHSIMYLEFLSGYIEREVWKNYNKDTSQTFHRVKEQFIDLNLTGKLKEYILANWAYETLTDKNDIETGKQLLETLETFQPGSEYVGLLHNTLLLARQLQPGKPAPDFTLPDQRGEMVSLSSFRGKVVYLDIWASWCAPCLGEIPHAQKLEKEFRNKDVVFLCVSIEDDETAWKSTIKKKDMTGVHLLSRGNLDSEVAKLYNVRGIPQYIIIGKDGLILDINAKRPGNDVASDLNKWLE